MLERTLFGAADYLVYSADQQLVMVVEVKVRAGAERQWAMQTRRNLLAHVHIPNVEYLLLAHPQRFYLWHNAGVEPALVEPTYEVDPLPFLQPYYEKSGLSPETISGSSFEFLIYGWLNELAIFGVTSELPTLQRQFLEESGLLNALARADIVGNYPI
jgi:hypothetical protein